MRKSYPLKKITAQLPRFWQVLLSAFVYSFFAVFLFGILYFFLNKYLIFAAEKWLIFGVIFLGLFVFIYQYLQLKTVQTVIWSFLPIKNGFWSFDPLKIPVFLRFFALSMFFFALAKPQLNTEYWDDIEREGIEIVLSLDMSGSMMAMDFSPNRLEAAKAVSIDFINHRKQDKIGLVLFEGQAYLQCPITSDHPTLIKLFKQANTGKVQPGTAIGAGLAAALNALRQGLAKTRIIILLTDGVNESPSQISPELALELAKTMGIRVYTIGVGTNGLAKFPAKDVFGNIVYQEIEVKIDEVLLEKIAQETGGKYYRATDDQKLKEIYKDIDLLEKDKLKITQYAKIPERFYWFLSLAFLALLLERLYRSFLRTIHG